MIKITNGIAEDFLNHAGLSKLMVREDKKLFVLRYQVAKLKIQLERKIKLFIEKRNELLNTYAVRNEDGSPVTVGNGIKISDIDEFNKHMKDLVDSPIELTDDYKLMDIDPEDEKFSILSGEEVELLLLLKE